MQVSCIRFLCRCFVQLLKEIPFLFLRFLFLSHIQVFPFAVSAASRLKYPYSCFSSHFYFLVFVLAIFLFVFHMLLLLLLAVVISFSLLFLMFSRPVFIHLHRLVSPFLTFFLTQVIFLFNSRMKTLCLVINFLVLPPSSILRMVRSLSYKWNCPGVNSFDEITATKLCFEQFTCFSELLFSCLFFHLCL